MNGSLVVVATPIGNLGDLTPRALAVLTTADVVYCEDTRHSRKLFSANGLATPNLLALHEHNESSLCNEVVRRVAEGQTVALVTDAGTPGVSDPGYLVIAAVAAAGLVVTTAPGPSAAIAALTISGLPMDRFVVEGFLPRKASELATKANVLARETRTIVFYESPQRLGATLLVLSNLMGERRAVVARELTKMHEEISRGTVSELAALFATREVLGEITVVLEGAVDVAHVDDQSLEEAIRDELAAGTTVRDAATHVAQLLGTSRRRVYELALAMQRERDR